ncbi:unnamed protein product [Rotaria sp. Silwood1]|nr:unnamed protein product [Rotaria sp. Silwood1]
MLSSNLNQKLLKTLWNSIVLNKQFLRNGQYQSNILNNYANIYRPEIESELEYLAVQTSRNKSLQIDYEIDITILNIDKGYSGQCYEYKIN